MISKLLPHGIVCVDSALFYNGYSDFAPRKWAVAVPRSFSREIKAMNEVPIKAYYINDKLHRYGATIGDFNSVSLKVYDRERTICDCFKYRSRLDNETFNRALNAYACDTEKNLQNLSAYAIKLKVYKKVTETMEVLLNA